MKWSDALTKTTKTRKDIEAILDAVGDEAQRRLGDARDRLRRMIKRH